MRTLAGLFLALGVFLAGCGGDDLDGETGSTRSAVEVAEDEDASAAAIIAAGRPFDADGAGDGSRLVLYRVVGETGESVQSAWRLYGPDGHPVADGKGGDTVLGLGDGFWLGDVIVGTQGASQEPAMAPEPLAPRPGDLVVSDFERIRALRPDPLTVFAPRPVPRGFGQGWALDAAGRQWYQRVEPEEVLVSGGGGWEPVRAVPVRPASTCWGSASPRSGNTWCCRSCGPPAETRSRSMRSRYGGSSLRRRRPGRCWAPGPWSAQGTHHGYGGGDGVWDGAESGRSSSWSVEFFPRRSWSW